MEIIAVSKLKSRKLCDGKSIMQYLKDRIDYGKNPDKTEGGRLVSTYQCFCETAAEEFTISKQLYANLTGRSQPKQRDVLSYFLLQSFRPGEVKPEIAHEIGYQLALEFTQGNHAFVVSTHVDRNHIHTHIEFNSTRLDCMGKFRNVKNSYLPLRKISDRLCKEYGLSVIENPKEKGSHYAQWKAEKDGMSYKAQLKQTIDCILPECKTFEEFLNQMRKEGYEVEQRSILKFRAVGQERFTRSKTLGANYTEQALYEKIYGHNKQSVPDHYKINLLIDIQSKVATGKGRGYEQWAKIFNLKEAARTLNFLTKCGISHYAELEQKSAQKIEQFQKVSSKMKQLEGRMSEVAELKYHIIRYSKTREIYKQYQQSRESSAFRLQHSDEIAAHEAAKKAFDKWKGNTLPKVSELQAEYSKLLEEKKELNRDYVTLKKEMEDYQAAKKNIDQILQIEQMPLQKHKSPMQKEAER